MWGNNNLSSVTAWAVRRGRRSATSAPNDASDQINHIDPLTNRSYETQLNTKLIEYTNRQYQLKQV